MGGFLFFLYMLSCGSVSDVASVIELHGFVTLLNNALHIPLILLLLVIGLLLTLANIVSLHCGLNVAMFLFCMYTLCAEHGTSREGGV